MFRLNKKGKSRLKWDKVQDSGKRTAFTTGSQRDTQEGKGRYDLIPTSMLHRLAQHYENGALKYGDNNWQKGQSLSQYYNSAMRHLNAIRDADLSEDHFAAVIWNIAAMIHHVDAILDGSLSEDLDNFGIVAAIKSEEEKQIAKEQKIMDEINKALTSTRNYITYDGTVRYMVSGVHTDTDMYDQLRDYDVTGVKVVYDRDRFKDLAPLRTHRTVKLDPEELG